MALDPPQTAPKVCLVIGAGDGVGGAIAKAFAAEGMTVCVTRRARNLDQLEALAEDIRKAGGRAHAFGVDARDEAEMVALFDKVEAEVGPLEVVVFNIGANVRFTVLETTTRVFQKVWEMACFAGFLTIREAARVMTPRGRGTILVTGATASIRGGKMYSAFASAKAALRSVAQTAGRELGPVGVHVAHIVVDGAIDGVFTRTNNSPEAVAAKLAGDEILKPDEIARSYVWLHNQNRSAWTHELDLRPWKETW
ncbi:SDR family NAD(P)-dependent oxidoreductase [Phenylobacterium sp. 20VBR1]|uniref:SDR family NAD(P)-dependent oxidoreductase n=1 Tax=Phenylobacterium glaciei TaxID=2803784 RepID=A0A941D1C4_9CAUL|nr:SDR family NAD(P)-dependent oxidoreductase [Phenylobacterium glaciei]MBR7618503.1 SDR family NAD(P)-dependent oxidoreductase [Phenylobacterium glaciei]